MTASLPPVVSLPLARVILFVADVPVVAAFYRDMLGCEVLGEITDGWAELRAGGCNIALHAAGAHPPDGRSSPTKLVFGTADVAGAREALVAAGVNMGALKTFGELHLCDGRDPAGNPFQLSNRGYEAAIT